MSPEDDDGGWGRDGRLRPENMLYVYRSDDPRAQNFIKTVRGARHEGRLFIHDICTGNRLTYTASHVNQLLTDTENPDGIKERIVSMIPRLSAQQQQWLADGINDAALQVVEQMEPAQAFRLRELKGRSSEAQLT